MNGMPKLIRRGRRYYVSLYNAESRRTERRSLKTTDLAQAKKLFARQVVLMDDLAREGLPITVTAALEDYLIDHVFPNCADPRRQEIAATHLAGFFGSKPLADVDIPLCRAYAAARRSGQVVSGLSNFKGRRAVNSTIRRELATLAAAANHAKKWRRIPAASMPSIELTRSEDQPGLAVRKAKFFSREQVAQLLFNAVGEVRDIIKLAYYTGARRASIEGLTAGQVDLACLQIDMATPGKRRTKKRQPIVPVLKVNYDDLRRLTDGLDPTDRVFAAAGFYHNFNLLCRRLGFERPHHPHMLRHSRATHLLQDGLGVYDVATLLGDTMKTVEANYGHHSADDLRGKLE